MKTRFTLSFGRHDTFWVLAGGKNAIARTLSQLFNHLGKFCGQSRVEATEERSVKGDSEVVTILSHKQALHFQVLQMSEGYSGSGEPLEFHKLHGFKPFPPGAVLLRSPAQSASHLYKPGHNTLPNCLYRAASVSAW